MTPPAGPSSLDALLAAIGELPATDRAPSLRARLDYALDVAEANELEYFTFLSECALLAVDSMQDVRLANVELTVAALVDPPPKEWGEVITDVVLTFAMQAAILVLWEGAAAGVLLVRGQAQIRAAQRAAEAAAFTERTTRTELATRLKDLRSDLAALGRVPAQQRISAIKPERLQILARGGYHVEPSEAGWLIKPASPDAFEPFVVDRLVLTYQGILDRTGLVQQATKRNAGQIVAALKKYDTVLAGGADARAAARKEWGEGWRNTIGSEKGGVIVAVTQAALEGALTAGGADGKPSDQPFLASEVAGRYLDWAAEERLGVVQTYANLRMTLRSTSDADLVAGDSFLQYLGTLATEVVQRLQEARQRYRAARPALTHGFEAVFWREYLQANGVLADPGEAEVALLGKFDRGEVTGDHLILERFQDDPATRSGVVAGVGEVRYLARRYPGAGRIPDLLAANLFRRFAAPYYADHGHAATLDPFVYRAEQYAGARIPPADDFWGYPEPEGIRLVQEMRFLVVRFFLEGIPDAPGDVATAGLAAAEPTAEERARQAWLAAQAVGTETDGRDPAADVAASRAAEALFMGMSIANPPPAGSPLARDLAELKLTVALTDLNLDIQAYVLLSRGAFEAEDMAGQRDADKVLQQIDDGKAAVAAAWADLLAQAGDERDRFVAVFGAAVRAVDAWRPGATWVWYGPDQPRP